MRGLPESHDRAHDVLRDKAEVVRIIESINNTVLSEQEILDLIFSSFPTEVSVPPEFLASCDRYHPPLVVSLSLSIESKLCRHNNKKLIENVNSQAQESPLGIKFNFAFVDKCNLELLNFDLN